MDSFPNKSDPRVFCLTREWPAYRTAFSRTRKGPWVEIVCRGVHERALGRNGASRGALKDPWGEIVCCGVHERALG